MIACTTGERLQAPDADRSARQGLEARLAQSSMLAFRIAFSVLRQREDAEDVAQEALMKSYRALEQLAGGPWRHDGWPA